MMEKVDEAVELFSLLRHVVSLIRSHQYWPETEQQNTTQPHTRKEKISLENETGESLIYW